MCVSRYFVHSVSTRILVVRYSCYYVYSWSYGSDLVFFCFSQILYYIDDVNNSLWCNEVCKLICVLTCAWAGMKTWPPSHIRQQTKRHLSSYRQVLYQTMFDFCIFWQSGLVLSVQIPIIHLHHLQCIATLNWMGNFYVSNLNFSGRLILDAQGGTILLK